MIDLFAILSVILFWGFQTNNIIFAIILIIFLGFPLFINSKNNFSFPLFKFASLVSYFLLFIVIYYYLNNNTSFFLGGVLKWSPLILLPLVSLELYSYDKKILVKSLLIFVANDNKKVKILYYYIFFVVLAASLGKKGLIFYVSISVFFAILLFFIKPKRYRFATWLIIFVLLMFSSFIVQNGVSDLHKKLVDTLINFLMGIDNNNIDISKSSTRIGSIGKLKLSDKIIYRLKADKNNYPWYLREATYTKYFNGDWVAPESKFLNFNDDLCSYKFKNKKTLKATLFGEFEKTSILPLHTRISKLIRRKNKETFSKNELMVIKREGVETNSISFEYYKDNISCLDKKFSRNDLAIPKNEKFYIDNFIRKAHLSSKTPVMKVLKRLNRIFNTKYKYSLNLKKGKRIKSALGNFLLETKAGHCEYFATATTLILRELGIPARYTVGYSVQEYSELENAFIIRQRHAHAWVRVLVNNEWYNFDTTPSSWLEIENKKFAFYYKIYDYLSYIEYKFKNSSIWSFTKKNYQYSIVFLTIIFIIIRYKNRNKQNKNKLIIKKSSKIFKKIDKILKSKKIIRNKDIPIEIWLADLSDNDKELIKSTELNEIISQYYIIRFSDKEVSKDSLKLIYKKIKIWKKIIKKL